MKNVSKHLDSIRLLEVILICRTSFDPIRIHGKKVFYSLQCANWTDNRLHGR